jgi:flagellar hook-length control protein FliK
MLLPVANAGLPAITLPGGLATEADASAGAFVDLLGLIMQGKLVALPTDEAGPLLQAADGLPLPSGETPLANIMAMLFSGQLPAPQPSLIDLARAPEGESAEPASAAVGLAIAGSPQKKLPTPAAVLAAMAATGQAAEAEVAAQDEPLLLAKPLDLAAKVTASFGEPRMGIVAPSQAVTPLPVSASNALNPDSASVPILASPLGRETELAQTGTRVVTHVAAPLLSREWRSELGDRVAWLVGRQAQSAEIILNPPALGSIEVRLNLNLAGNEAGAQFYSANPNVRDALEAAFPRLRELMANAGIALGEATVSSQSFSERQAQEQSAREATDGESGQPAGIPLAGVVAAGTSRIPGLVDLYI